MRLKLKTSQTRLADILKNTTLREQFIDYLQNKEKSIENLDFVLWYEDYNRRFPKTPLDQQRVEVDNILQTYFDGKSLSELNLDEDVKLTTLKNVKLSFDNSTTIDPLTFKHAYDICFHLIESSSIPTFTSLHRKRPSLRNFFNLRRSSSGQSHSSRTSTI
ncbi:hypothetical protein E3Q23_03680 [Wallemia mellicola]|uniref:RGS domain-containing protein n=1 Tax=Wallemia mellicola TaxID=1708541 RepID=A0A4T0TE91_9BASI|nr:hypothetical protein E3Q24_03630 [Wallemia mellicola]TIB71720.1 hypothetical protein E3Q23_03680 [Wallemia mellicola]TIB80524.1 hypothetical protein E3Q21_03722 [Wallemia mellicola]TIB84536.1 hypothetical protein E3Q20_03629 [Wallemia mellicola]TIB96712.1 hypothetical protein E3Q17_03713 [Wallemia mellicola]